MSLPVSSEQLNSVDGVWGGRGAGDDEGKIKAFFCVFACERHRKERRGENILCAGWAERRRQGRQHRDRAKQTNRQESLLTEAPSGRRWRRGEPGDRTWEITPRCCRWFGGRHSPDRMRWRVWSHTGQEWHLSALIRLFFLQLKWSWFKTNSPF